MFRKLILFFPFFSSIFYFNGSLEAIKNFANFDLSTKKQILRKATKVSKNKSPEQLARQLDGVYTQYFERNLVGFQVFLLSQEFSNILKRKPHRREMLNKIAIQRSVTCEASGDLRVERGEHPLFSVLTSLFGSDLVQVQYSLREAIVKATHSTEATHSKKLLRFK